MKRTTDTLLVLDRDGDLFDVLLGKITVEDRMPYEVCQEMGLSWGAVLAWANRDAERIAKFKAALEVRSHLLAEAALRIADAAKPRTVNVAKLKVETRKWMAARFNPKQFGEYNQVEHTGTVTNLMAVLSALPTRGVGEVDITPQPEGLEDKAA